jgi:Uma2 family endonuclease
MTLAQASVALSLDDHQHIVLEDVSWEFYERLIKEIGERHIRVTFDSGRMEIMSPLSKHELYGEWIGRLIELICLDRSIPVVSLGSTTFKLRRKKKGLESDKCFYFRNSQAAAHIEGQFDPALHPAPELAVEIDITRRSIPRQPIYAALRVPEIWRFDGKQLQVLHLSSDGEYIQRARSRSLPFLPMSEFAAYIPRIKEANQILVLREFRQWAQSLPA